MNLLNKLFRAWYYFRNGYGMYLAFFLGFLGFISTTYYLAIQNLPFEFLKQLTIFQYAVGVIIAVVPIGLFLGWLHMKRLPAYRSQMEIDIESNPYNYKLIPGINTEITWKIWEVLLPMLSRLGEREEVLTQEEKKILDETAKKVKRLLAGEMIGAPKLMDGKRK